MKNQSDEKGINSDYLTFRKAFQEAMLLKLKISYIFDWHYQKLWGFTGRSADNLERFSA